MKKTMKKGFSRLLAMFLALIMIITVLPANALAATEKAEEDNSVNITFSLTTGEDLYTAEETSETLVQKNLAVPYFDLALYGLERYYYNPDCYTGESQKPGTAETADGIVTLMHVFIYATEVYKLGYDPKDAGKGGMYKDGTMDDYISWTGNAGSSFMSMWEKGTNLNYYINYTYPLGRLKWGSTSDQQPLNDGDIIDVHWIQSKSAYGSNFSFMEMDGVKDAGSIPQTVTAELTVYHTQPDYDTFETTYTRGANEQVYIAAEADVEADISTWEKLGTTDENGVIKVDTTDLAVGKYYIATEGWDDKDSGQEYAASAFILNVTEKPLQVQAYSGNEEEGTLVNYEVVKTDAIASNGAPVYRVAVPVDTELKIADNGTSSKYGYIFSASGTMSNWDRSYLHPIPLSATLGNKKHAMNATSIISNYGENTGVDYNNMIIPIQVAFTQDSKEIRENPVYIILVEVTGIQKVETVTLDKTEATVKVNETDSLTATIAPEDAALTGLTWVSSDTNIATVSGGTVKGMNPGTATIKAIAYNNVVATCDVTVVESDVMCNVTLPESDRYVVTGDAQVQTGKDYTFNLEIMEGYKPCSDFVVKAGNTVLEPNEDGSYTAKYVVADLVITVEGVVADSYFELVPSPLPLIGHSSWGYISSLKVSGENGSITGHQWSADNKILSVVLGADTPDDAIMNVKATVAGMRPTLSGGGDVTLVDGQTSTNVSVKQPFGTGTLTVKLKKDTIPTLAEGVEATKSVTMPCSDTFEIDLATLFTDADDDPLTYQVKADDGTYTDLEGTTYTFSDKIAKTHNFVFRAYDGFAYSEDTYSVELVLKNSEITYDVSVLSADSDEVEFYCADEYNEDGYITIGEPLTAEVSKKYGGFLHTVKVPENVERIVIEENGARAVVDTAEGMNQIVVQKAHFIAETLLGDKDATATFAVTDASGNKVTGSGADFLLVSGMEYTFVATPSRELTSKWAKCTMTAQTVTEEYEADITMVLPIASPRTITIDKDAELHLYYQSRYYVMEEVEPVLVTENEDTITYTYACTSYTAYACGYMYFATKDNYIDKAGYLVSSHVDISWKDDERTSDYRGEYDTSTTYGARGDDSILVNINSQNHLVLDEGDTFRLRSFRIWEIINTDTENVMIEPEFTYDYNEDLISMVPANENLQNGRKSGTSGNNWMDITATGKGVDFLEVGYEAVHIVTGYADGSWGGAWGQVSDFTYNAIDPSRTALIVVQTDGKAATDVKFKIDSFCSDVEGDYYDKKHAVEWDAEFDTLYFVGDKGQITFSPSTKSGSIKEVAVSSDKGVTWTVLEANRKGIYTADIYSGNNVIRVTKDDGTTAYQVVRGDKITYDITIKNDADGNGEVSNGDTVRVTLNGLHNPIGKMSGIYNPGYGQGQRVTYTWDGAEVRQNGYYQYDFVSNAWIEVTVPEDAEGEYALTDGYINLNVFGDAPGNHRNLTDGGRAVNTSAESSKYTRSILPDIVVMEDKEFVAAKENAKVEVEEYLYKYLGLEAYAKEQQEELQKILAETLEKIEAAEFGKELETAIEEGKAAMEAVDTEEELEAKFQAIKALEEFKAANYNEEDYREEQQRECEVVFEVAVEAINSALTVAEIDAAVEAAKAAFTAIQTAQELEAQELAEAKVAASIALDNYKDSADYRASEKEALATIIATAKSEIESATDKATVDSVIAEAKAAMDALKSNVELSLEETQKALEEAQKVAEEAQEKLDEVLKKQEEDVKYAEEAQKVAEEAAKAAEEAQKVAEEAQKAAEEALEEALKKQEEDAAAAEATQKALEEAQKVAEATQKEFEEAQKAAEEAQKVAEEAQKATEEAQKEAEEATKAAEEAEKAKKEAEEAAKKAEEDATKEKETAAKYEAAMNALLVTSSKAETVTVSMTETNSVVVEWSAVKGAEKYTVNIMKNGEVIATVETAATTYTYENAKAGYAYTAVIAPIATLDGTVYKGASNEATFVANPSKPVIAVKKTGSKVKITAKKRVCTGYQIQICKNKKFKSGVKKYTVNKAKLNKVIKLSKLKKGKNFIRVRAFTKYNGAIAYSKWSKVKTVKK